jgi:carboxypeptidase C (cathepsin A)
MVSEAQDVKKDAGAKANEPEIEIPDPIVRRHELSIGRKTLKYTTTTGLMPIRDDKGTLKARLFFTAYTLDDPETTAARPLTFTYNGGPGSASVWLHMGGLAPRRVEMLEDGAMPRPPFRLVDNEYTWLEHTDLVFIDPVDTGFSRAVDDDEAKKAKDVKGDIETVGEFIRLYLARTARWTSPLFLCGESYGTFRSAGLAGYLIERGIAFNGIILISSILNMQTARFTLGNDLPHQLFLPTFAATAWFHNRVAKDLKKKDVRAFLDEVEAWVEDVYVPALSLGDRLPEDRRAKVLDGLERYTGLSRAYLDQANLRINIHQFVKELCRDELRTVGRLDSRFKGADKDGVADEAEFDPSMAAIRPPFTSVLNAYFRNELGYESDVEYHILRGLDWNWGDAKAGYADTSDDLRAAFAKNPYMRLFVASGYYDLATPYYATEYTISHMGLDRDVRDNVRVEEYPTGHMIYIDYKAMVTLRDHVASFIQDAISG